MTDDQLPDVGTPFGRRVRERLESEEVIWLTPVAPSGTPQPNPVWFLWTGSEIVIYNHHAARRLAWLRERPMVSLHFNSDDAGDDIVVFTGTAEVDPELPAPQDSPDYVTKYGSAMARISGSLEDFGELYSVGVRVRISRVRGY